MTARDIALKSMNLACALDKELKAMAYTLERIAEERDVGRHDGLPELSPVLCESEMCDLAKKALARYQSFKEGVKL